LSADSEQTVKSGAELLDRLIKDVVSELSTTYVSPYQQPLNPVEDNEQQELLAPTSLPRNTAFSLPRFIPLLRQRIYVQNSNARQYLVSWIAVLDSIPDLELVSFLPEFLDGLIQCLNDPSGDVRTSTKSLLAGFLQDIRQAATTAAEVKRYMRGSSSPSSPSPSSSKENESPTLDQTDVDVTLSSTTTTTTTTTATTATTTTAAAAVGFFMESDGQGKGTYFPGQGIVVQYARIVEILIPHLSSSEQDIQRTALEWINEFTIIAKDIIIQFTPEIIKAVLPSLAHHVPVIKEFATATNQSLQKLVMEAPVTVRLSPNATTTSTSDSLISTSSLSANNPLSPTQQSAPDPFDYQATLTNLRLQFLNEHEDTRVASLEWLLMLHKKAPHKVSTIVMEGPY
jgi:vacuole morphology and inheritance protein 14